MQFRRAMMGVAAALALVAVPALAAEPPASVFGPGEQSTYQISYLGMTAGTAVVTVGSESRQWGKEVWPIVAVAKSELALYPIKDKFITYWDPKLGGSHGSDLMADENRKKRRQRIKVDHVAKTAVVSKQKEGEEESSQSHEVEPGALDIAAAAYALRNKPLEVGGEYDLPVFTGARSFTMRAKVESKEKITTSAGPREAFKLRVQTSFSGKFESKRDLFAYLSADELHVPLRIEADFVLGTIMAELTDFKQGRDTAKSAGSAGY